MSARSLWTLSAACGLVAVLAGCVLSIDEIVPESDALFDQRLLGTWKESGGRDRAVVSRGEGNAYRIEYTTEGKAGRFDARLGRLGERLVLDVWPAPQDGELPPPYGYTLVAGHSLAVLDVSDGEIRMSWLDPDVLQSALRDGSVRLAYGRLDDRVILRAGTPELRSQLGAYLGRPGALTEPDIWRATVAKPPGPVEPPCFEAAAWREADQLFHRDPHWLGGDVASTVDLGGERTLWLFGDSWIDPTGAGTRRGAAMVSNSVAIQTGRDPATARMAFYWGRRADGRPDALFPDRGVDRLWFGNGVRVDDRLVLFFGRTITIDTGAGFEHVGWTAVMVENPDAEPSAWRVRPLDTPANPLGILVGFAAVMRMGDHVYALGSQNPVKSHPIFAARWRAEEVRRGSLQAPEWWAGDRLGWVPDSSSTQRWPLFEEGASELSVHLDPATQRFIAVQTRGFGPADVTMRAAPSLTGPWCAPRLMYRPPEYYRPKGSIYAGKAHPELTGADLVLTYATNTSEFGEYLSDPRIYYPRFVRLTRCR